MLSVFVYFSLIVHYYHLLVNKDYVFFATTCVVK